MIIHVDMDAFFAAVETRDDPTLRGKPLIIGALPGERGVVSTCSYEARKFGVRSGMNIKDAYILCPKGIFMHPNIDKYKTVSAALHGIWNAYASAAESVALDEAYLDVTARAGDWEGAREIAREIKRRTREEVGLTCSVGLAYSKTAAKTASEEKKPDGYYEILTPEAFCALITDRDVGVLYTVGKMTAEKLRRYGIRTVRDVRESERTVVRLLGKQGEFITRLARGIDDGKVTPYRPEDAKTIGREVTFQEDTTSERLLLDVLFLLALCVERRAKRYALHGNGVTLKITFSDMKTITRSRLCPACDDAATIYGEAADLLAALDRKKPVRLIGVGIYHLTAEARRQLTIDDFLREGEDRDLRAEMFSELNGRYNLDFEGHLEQIYRGETLYKTVEYMRKHI